jgi:hypothetical protein
VCGDLEHASDGPGALGSRDRLVEVDRLQGDRGESHVEIPDIDKEISLESRVSMDYVDSGLLGVGTRDEEFIPKTSPNHELVSEPEIELLLLRGRQRRRALGVQGDPGKGIRFGGRLTESIDAEVVEPDLEANLEADRVSVVSLQKTDQVPRFIEVARNVVEVWNRPLLGWLRAGPIVRAEELVPEGKDPGSYADQGGGGCDPCLGATGSP